MDEKTSPLWQIPSLLLAAGKARGFGGGFRPSARNRAEFKPQRYIWPRPHDPHASIAMHSKDLSATGRSHFSSATTADAPLTRARRTGFDSKNRFKFRNGFSNIFHESAASARLVTKIIGRGK